MVEEPKYSIKQNWNHGVKIAIVLYLKHIRPAVKNENHSAGLCHYRYGASVSDEHAFGL